MSNLKFAPPSLIRIEKLLLATVLLELFLGGNGYLIAIGGLRLRVILSIFCMGWVAMRFTSGISVKLPRQIWGLFFLFLIVTAFGTLVGLTNDSRIGAVVNELRGLLYFPMILFFAIAIRDQKDIALVTRLIVGCGIVQAFLYLSLLLVAYSGLVSYSSIYLFLRESDEFIFRHNPESGFFLGFFYKGAFHLCIAALFLLLDPIKKNKWIALMMLAAIALTLSRGLAAALLLSLISGVFFVPRRNWVVLLMASGFIMGTVFLFTGLFGLLQRPVSDSVRLADLNIIWTELNVTMLLIGKGIGAIIGQRERIEMTYLEVFYKQGLVGLILWGSVLFTIFNAFRRVQGTLRRQQAFVFLLAALFVYFATATNTFLTGSIGMCIVLISAVVLLAMNNTEQRGALSLKGVASRQVPKIYGKESLV